MTGPAGAGALHERMVEDGRELEEPPLLLVLLESELALDETPTDELVGSDEIVESDELAGSEDTELNELTDPEEEESVP